MALPSTCILQDILSLDVTEDVPTKCFGTTSKSQPCQENLGKETRYKARQILREPVQLNREVVKDRITALVELLVHKTKHRRNAETRMRELEVVFIGKFDSYCEEQQVPVDCPEQQLPVDHSDSLEETPEPDVLSQTDENASVPITPATHTEHLRMSSPRNSPLLSEDRVGFGEFRSRSGAWQRPSRRLDGQGHQSRSTCPVPQILEGQMQTVKLTLLLSFIYALFQPYASAICVLFFSQHCTVDAGAKNVRGEAGKFQVIFGVKGSIAGLSGVVGLLLLCLVTLHQLTSFLLGSWGFVMASLACLVWSHSMRDQLRVRNEF